MNHIYFSATLSSAALAAELAKGEADAWAYIVEPTGSFENDPNLKVTRRALIEASHCWKLWVRFQTGRDSSRMNCKNGGKTLPG